MQQITVAQRPGCTTQTGYAMSAIEFYPQYRKLQGLMAALLAGATIMAAAMAINAAPAMAQDLVVKYDQSQLLRLPRRVSEIIIGNASIADATVQSGKLLVITGKTFGITNIIALDADKQIIIDKRVVVTRPTATVVNLTRGDARQSYSCTPDCNPSLVIGDDSKYFNKVGKDAKTKVSMSSSSGASGGGQAPAGQ